MTTSVILDIMRQILTAFNKDKCTQVWVIHPQEIIGKAANHISDDLQRQNPEIP